jgi:SSS family solute:Na+ symporter
MALFLYPHSLTGILSATGGGAIRRNAALLPAYSLLLGLLGLLGFMAIALKVAEMPQFADGFKLYGSNFAVPALFLAMFPSWFVGLAFAAIAIGALVPAAIMSIAAANIFTRNVYKEFMHPAATDAEQSGVAKLVSLVVKIGALAFIIFLPLKFAIQLQLLGGIWMIQTFPVVVIGLYTRFLNSWALLIGWACGMAVGTWMAYLLSFQGAVYPLRLFGTTIPGYAALYSVIVNIVVSGVLSVVFNLVASDRHKDATLASDYV